MSGQTVRRRLRESGLRARCPVVVPILKQRLRTARLSLTRARVVGSFTPGNTSFLVINPDFHFGLAMDVIVCATDVGKVLRTSVGTSPTVLEAELLWSGLEFVVMVELSSKFLRNIECHKDDIVDPIVLPFLQQRNFDHVFQP